MFWDVTQRPTKLQSKKWNDKVQNSGLGRQIMTAVFVTEQRLDNYFRQNKP